MSCDQCDKWNPLNEIRPEARRPFSIAKCTTCGGDGFSVDVNTDVQSFEEIMSGMTSGDIDSAPCADCGTTFVRWHFDNVAKKVYVEVLSVGGEE